MNKFNFLFVLFFYLLFIYVKEPIGGKKSVDSKIRIINYGNSYTSVVLKKNVKVGEIIYCENDIEQNLNSTYYYQFNKLLLHYQRLLIVNNSKIFHDTLLSKSVQKFLQFHNITSVNDLIKSTSKLSSVINLIHHSSKHKNTKLSYKNSNLCAISTKNMFQNEEILIDYTIEKSKGIKSDAKELCFMYNVDDTYLDNVINFKYNNKNIYNISRFENINMDYLNSMNKIIKNSHNKNILSELQKIISIIRLNHIKNNLSSELIGHCFNSLIHDEFRALSIAELLFKKS